MMTIQNTDYCIVSWSVSASDRQSDPGSLLDVFRFSARIVAMIWRPCGDSSVDDAGDGRAGGVWN